MKAPQGQEFYFCDGAVADTVQSLVEHIKVMDEGAYQHHVNKERNDFYNWINACIDKNVAKKIRSVKARKTLLAKLNA